MNCTRHLLIKSTRLPSLSLPRIKTKAATTLHSAVSLLERKASNTVQDQDKIVTVPNLLCFGRIVASPYLAYCIVNGELVQSLGIFCLAGFSDLVS